MDLDDMFGAFDPAAGNAAAANSSKDGSAVKPKKSSS